MKKIILIIATMAAILQAEAQNIPEPQFIGEVIMVNLDNGWHKKLPKERGILRVADFMGSQTKRIVLDTDKSPIEIADTTKCALIVRAENNLYDPISIVQVFKFERNIDGHRVTELGRSSSNNFYSQAEGNNKIYIEFEAEKYGESSYLLKIPVTAGQYGVITGNLDEGNLIIATFDIFDYEKRREDEYWRMVKLAEKQAREDRKAERKAKQESNQQM